ncbi:hypothetical protein [Nonomuraea sp. NPDC049784]|uniref:hypothetical protein n=1 Tax=unclassified Nonomuraea TaxID=2593643 RepID=UPI0033C09AC3
MTVGPGSVTVTVGPGSVTVTVGTGVTLTAGLPRFLYVPQPSLFADSPEPSATRMLTLVVLHDLPLQTFCLTEKRAASASVMDTFKKETPRLLTTFVVAV